MADMYKIRNPAGLFSTGGTYPTFSKDGKTWTKRGHLSNHLAQFNERELFKHYAGCEVVTFRIEVDGAEPIESHLRATAQRQRERKAESDRAREAWKRERDLAERDRLIKLYGAPQ